MGWDRLSSSGCSNNGRIRWEATRPVAQSPQPRSSLISRDLGSSRWAWAGGCWHEKPPGAVGVGRRPSQTGPEGMWHIQPLTQTPLVVAALLSHFESQCRPLRPRLERWGGSDGVAQTLNAGGMPEAGPAERTAHASPAKLWPSGSWEESRHRWGPLGLLGLRLQQPPSSAPLHIRGASCFSRQL